MPDVSLKRKQIAVVSLMVALSVMSYFDRTIISIAAPSIMHEKEFSLSEKEMGWIFSAFLFSYSILMIPGGRLADRFGPRKVLTAMGLGAALFTALTALGGKPGLGAYAGIVASFVAMRIGLGIFTAPIYPSCAAINRNWIPAEQRARVWGWVASGAGIGGAVSPLLFTWMISRHGWRTAFVLAGIATGLLGVIWFCLVRDYPPGARPSSLESASHRTPWAELLRNRDLMLLTTSYFLICYFEYMFFYWLYYYFGQIRKVGDTQSAIYTTFMWVSWMVMTPIGGWISDRLVAKYGPTAGRRWVPVVGLTLGAILLFIGVNLSNEGAVAALLCLALGCASASDGTYWAVAIQTTGKDVGAGSAIMNCGGNLGGSFAPILTTAIAARAGWSWGLYAGGIMMLAGVSLWFFIGSPKSVTRPVELVS